MRKKKNCKCEIDGLVWTYNVVADGKASVKGVSPAGEDSDASAESDGDSASGNKKGFVSAADFFGIGCDDDDGDKAGVSGDLVVPAELDGHPVSGIWDGAFKNNRKLTSVSLPAGVVTIGLCAFQGCSGLKSIEISAGVTEIGERAFEDCASLTSVTLPSKLTALPEALFSRCAKLKSVEIPVGVTEIGECAFKDCASLTSAALPPELETIPKSMFSGCAKLKSVVVPPSVTEIESAAFKGCSSLKSVEIPDDAADIAADAFDGSPAWKCVLEKAMVEWQYKVNDDGTATVTGVRPSDEESSGRRVMLEIPAKIDGHDVVEIGRDAFESAFEDDDQPDLVFVKVPYGVKRIGNGAFYGLEKLETVEIPDSVTEIGRQAFECSSVKSVRLPRGLTRVSGDLFLECTSLRSVEIPDGVTVIETNAFCGCSSLEYVEIPPSVTEIQEGAFESAMTVQLPPDVKFVDECGNPAGIECAFGDCWCVFRTVVKADDGTRMWKWVYDVDSKKATILGVVPSADGVAAPSTICGCKVGKEAHLYGFDTSVGQLRFYPRRYNNDDLESLREDFDEGEGERFFEELNDCHYDRCDGDPDKWMAVDEDATSSHKCIRDGFYVDYKACCDGNIHSSWDFYQDGEQIAGYSPCC